MYVINTYIPTYGSKWMRERKDKTKPLSTVCIKPCFAPCFPQNLKLSHTCVFHVPKAHHTSLIVRSCIFIPFSWRHLSPFFFLFIFQISPPFNPMYFENWGYFILFISVFLVSGESITNDPCVSEWWIIFLAISEKKWKIYPPSIFTFIPFIQS